MCRRLLGEPIPVSLPLDCSWCVIAQVPLSNSVQFLPATLSEPYCRVVVLVNKYYKCFYESYLTGRTTRSSEMVKI